MATALLMIGGSMLGASVASTAGLGVIGTIMTKAAFATAGGAIGGAIDRAIFPGPTVQQEGPRLSDMHVATATMGSHVPIVYGRSIIPGSIIWGVPLVDKTRTTTTTTGGGKGGGSRGSTVQTKEHYAEGTFAVAACEGPVTINKIIADGKIIWENGAVANGEELSSITIYSGTETQSADPTIQSYEGLSNTPGFRGLAYVVFAGWNLRKRGNRAPNIVFDVSGQIETLESIISDTCSRAGLSSGDWYSYGCAYTIIGLGVNSPSTARNILETLASTFQLTVCMSDDALRFRHYVTASAATIPWADLGAATGGNTEVKSRFDIESTPTHELPRAVAVQHQDPEREGQIGAQIFELSVTDGAQNELTMQTPVHLTGYQAKYLAAVIAQRAWTERDSCSFVLGRKYICIDPGDAVTISDPDGDFLCRVESVTYNPEGTITISGVRTSDASMTADVEPQGAVLDPTTTWGAANTLMVIMDMPMVTDYDSTLPLYFAAYGSNPGWAGGSLYQGTAAFGTTTDDSWIGTVTEVNNSGLAQFFIKDTTSTFKISRISTGNLSSVTTSEVFDGNNIFAIESSGPVGWEIVGAETATLGVDGQWTLSNLHRGLLGTVSEQNTHAAGNRVVLLDDTILKKDMLTGQRNVSLSYKGVSSGQLIGSVTATNFTWRGKSVRPLPPVHCDRRWFVDGGAILHWIRQTRGSLKEKMGDLRGDEPDGEGVDLPLNEQDERYEVEIYTSAAGTTRKRLIIVTPPVFHQNANVWGTTDIEHPSVLYTAAMQVADWGAAFHTPIYWQVFQISSIAGRGFGSGVITS